MICHQIYRKNVITIQIWLRLKRFRIHFSVRTLKYLYFCFLSNYRQIWSYRQFPLDYEPSDIPFGSKSKGNYRYDHIPFNLKGYQNVFLWMRGKWFWSIVVIRESNDTINHNSKNKNKSFQHSGHLSLRYSHFWEGIYISLVGQNPILCI